MNKSGIQWTDYTWSPVTGCSKVSRGCKHCYAEAWHKRFRAGDFSVKLHPDKLHEPLHSLKGFERKHGRRPRVFVGPMLGPVDLTSIRLTRLNWIVCGGESGTGARLMDTEWVRSLRDQCSRANVPFFFKQWGPEGGLLRDGLPALDGVVHKAFPEVMG